MPLYNMGLAPVIRYHYSGYTMIAQVETGAKTRLKNADSDPRWSDRDFMSGLFSAFTLGVLR